MSREYAHEPECRAMALRRYFGEIDGPPCNICDVCRGRPERPDSFWEPIATPEHRKKRQKRQRRRGRGRRRGGNAAAAPSAPEPPPPAE